MGKKGGTSWLTVVKRAFRSPTRDSEKKNSRRREDQDHEDEEKKREKRRWIFRKSTTTSNNIQQCETRVTSNSTPANPALDAEQRHAIAAAAAAAEAAVATAQAAVEIVRLTRPSTFLRERYAAIIIQTSFRGYLARRAYRALRGLVKLQALIRGQNVRKQAKTTLKCMQALVRAQARIQDQRGRLSHEGSRKSMFAESNGLWESKTYQTQEVHGNKLSKDGSCTADDLSQNLRTLEDLEAMLQNREGVSFGQEKAQAQAFFHQMWKSGRDPSGEDEVQPQENLRWLDQWMAAKQWESDGRASTDKRESIKTVEVDTSQPYSTPNFRRQQHQHHHQRQPNPQTVSPLHRAQYCPSPRFAPATPPQSKPRPLQLHSASPRRPREERSYSTAHTPNLGSANYINTRAYRHGVATVPLDTALTPNCMAATESAKAKARSQSAPRQAFHPRARERGLGQKATNLSCCGTILWCYNWVHQF
ncbi:IQ motif, EF-hand binding site [Dillenia turbinata]|uniref:IQ motif, EF-hand binding site n=1 Tax=Dillenia turbinata TaxID=194707 RepID=A0AAN8VK98_9MAGN